MLNLKNIDPIGIDITDQAIYAAQFKNVRRGRVVGNLFSRQLPDGLSGGLPVDGLIPELKAVAKARQFKGKLVNMLLPERHVNSFLVTFDLGVEDTLEGAIARECRRSLSFPLEEAIIDYASLIESKKKKRRYKAAIVAMRKEIVKNYMSLARRAGLSIAVIDSHLSALLRVHQYLYNLSEEDPVLLCNVDDTTTLLSVVTRERILAQRQVSWGLQPIIKRLASDLGLGDDDDQATAMLSRYGLVYEKLSRATSKPPVAGWDDQRSDMNIYRTLFRLLTPYAEDLIHELYQITGYVRSEMDTVRFDKIVMYGWASAINYLDQYIENRINIPTKSVNPLAKLIRRVDSHDLEGIQGVPFAPALGLALRKVSWL